MLLRENVPFFYDISQDAAGIRFRKAFFHAVSNSLFNIHTNIIFKFICASTGFEFNQFSVTQMCQSNLNIGFVQACCKRNKLFRCCDFIGIIDHSDNRNALDNSRFHSSFNLRECIVSLQPFMVNTYLNLLLK